MKQSSKDYLDSLRFMGRAYEKLQDMWNKVDPDGISRESRATANALKTIVKLYSQGIDETPEERAESHMMAGMELLDAGIREAAQEFLTAKNIYKKLNMSDKARQAQRMFAQARRLR